VRESVVLLGEVAGGQVLLPLDGRNFERRFCAYLFENSFGVGGECIET
jgi:hypothetical protein